MNHKNCFCIIPARGGSKRIPKKNIKSFLGSPIISYAIRAAQDSNIFERIIVSTDDEEVANVAIKYGAEVPFMRPSYLADDHAGTVPVIKHAIETLTKHGDDVIKDVFCIYPCSPLLNSRDLIDAYKLYMEIGNWNNYLFSIAQYHSAPQRAFTLRNDLKTIPMYPEYERVRTQDLEQTYFDAGQFYCGAKDLWVKGKNLHSFGMGYVIPNFRVADIDTENDWARAEIQMKVLRNIND